MNAQVNKFLRLPLLAGGIAMIAISGIAIVSLAGTPGSRNESAASAEPAQVATAPAGAAAVSRSYRCAECGVIQSTRKIEARDERAGSYAPAQNAARRRAESGETPAQNYEITIRLQDGSLRVINDAHSAAWRPGEAVTLIAGINSQGK